MQSPLEITDTEQYWLRSRDVSDSSKIGGEDYFSDYDITRPKDVESDDLPPAANEAVREIEREALEKKKTISKWQVTGSTECLEHRQGLLMSIRPFRIRVFIVNHLNKCSYH